MEKISDRADFYDILGVSRNATEQEINKAYKKLAVKYHPDKNPSQKELAEENFKKVSEAYEVLSNKDKRQTFDQFGKKGLDGMGGGGGGGGFSRGQAEEIFAQFFGGQDPFSVLFSQMGGADGMPGGGGVQFAFGGMPGGGRGGPSMGGGMPGGGLPPGFAQMMGGMGGGMPQMQGMGGMGGMPQMQGMGGMGGMPQMQGMGGGRRRQPEQSSVLPPGTRVVVRGLQGAPQHNGKEGEVDSYDASSSRYLVQLAGGDGEVLRIKFANLLQNVRCEVLGMQNREELNGRSATLVGYDEDKGRFHADIAGVGRASLLPTNLILPKGARGTVVGLTSAAGSKWNEQVGKVLSFDKETGRYTLEMTLEDQLRIKPQNLVF